MQIKISWKGNAVLAELADTPFTRKLKNILPCQAEANRWGDEVYFSVPLETELESNAQQIVEPGTVCFWVEGQSIAIPFGPTPISRQNECRLVTRVNVLGRLLQDPKLLKTIQEGDQLLISSVK